VARAHTAFTTSSPLAGRRAAAAPLPNSTWPTGWMRARSLPGVEPRGSAPCARDDELHEKDDADDRHRERSSTTVTSCCGVLMNDSC
jgi:hypothetical protein